MSIHINKLKVRPRKNVQATVCGKQLSEMLGCWAAKNDLSTSGACAEHAVALFHCMRTTPMPKKTHRPAINYHLARLGKNIQ